MIKENKLEEIELELGDRLFEYHTRKKERRIRRNKESVLYI
jgi:hypothetical protein